MELRSVTFFIYLIIQLIGAKLQIICNILTFRRWLNINTVLNNNFCYYWLDSKQGWDKRTITVRGIPI